MNQGSQSSKPLAGVRVLDLTQFLSGPYATMILGDLGAEVIKVEPPQGDATRTIPPNFVGEDSAYYLSINRNKRSIVVDLKKPQGRELVLRLAKASDIVIENYRPGVMDRLGLGYGELSRANPAIIWASISGFGQDGPYRDYPAYDMIVQALSGGMSLTGESGRPAVRAGIPIGDLAAGMFSVIGILAALHECKAAGRGKRIDVAMLDCQVSMLCYQAAYYLVSGKVPGPQGREHDSFATYRTFEAGDGVSVVVCANTEKMWQDMARILGLNELVDDARFRTNADRHEHRGALGPLMEAAFLRRPAQEWILDFKQAGIPVGVVNKLDHALSDPHVLHRNMVVHMNDEAGHEVRVAGNPVKFTGEPESPPAYPPRFGSDTRSVLSDVLGCSAQEIASLLADQVVLDRMAERKPISP
ncbi:MAG: CoA transferase [Betaproteobacteria bacterium]|nr:CoA transferase [Betaproteobacteria bacterium]